jgi:putative FmdB family regulatory protein
MPDYDFFCRRCKRVFGAHMTIKQHDERVSDCPHCRKPDQVERRIGSVNVVTRKKS